MSCDEWGVSEIPAVSGTWHLVTIAVGGRDSTVHQPAENELSVATRVAFFFTISHVLSEFIVAP